MATLNDPNLAILQLVATALGPVCNSVVFVGGCATGLWATKERADRIRITEDVDIVAQALTVRDYHVIESRVRAFGTHCTTPCDLWSAGLGRSAALFLQPIALLLAAKKRLAAHPDPTATASPELCNASLGFNNDMRPGAPICRWVYQNITLDLMPTVKDILGFANRWYPHAIATAMPVTLPGGSNIRLISAPAFIATKLEAFKDRGKTADGKPDFLGSHDLEDIITVVDRRPELLGECQGETLELRNYLAAEFTALFANRDFEPSLSGHLPGNTFSQQRVKPLVGVLRQLASLEPRQH